MQKKEISKISQFLVQCSECKSTQSIIVGAEVANDQFLNFAEREMTKNYLIRKLIYKATSRHRRIKSGIQFVYFQREDWCFCPIIIIGGIFVQWNKIWGWGD